MELTHRKADLPTLAQALQEQRTRAVDVVAGAPNVWAQDGHLMVSGVDPVMDENGVTDANGRYALTTVGEEGVAEKLGIPLAYLRRTREVDGLWTANVNAWIEHNRGPWLLRLLQDRTGDPQADGIDGYCRALLSDRYRTIDNFDVLLATLAGVEEAGGAGSVEVSGDLTERRMVVRVQSTAVSAMAPELLKDYRSPFSGQTGKDCPVVWAGFVVGNSDTGGGAFTITPRLVVQICTNGMTMAADGMRAVHLGGKLEQGAVRWSEDTQRRNLALVTGQARDAVNTFLSAEYVEGAVRRLEAQAGAPVKDAPATIAAVSKRLGFTDTQSKGILDRFIQGGSLTAGGIMQAITAAAQDQESGDAAWDMERQAVEAMGLAVAVQATA